MKFMFPLLALLLFATLPVLRGRAATDPAQPAAKFKISGFGLIGDRQLKNMIRLVELQTNKPAFFDGNFIEDSSLILASKTRAQGYLKATVSADITRLDGQTMHYVWSETNPLPRPLRARRVEFKI